ncbi:MAG: 50S ribosomal protein L6 [Omnitrophica bacterium]|nr:50S ribosomal protein L6 [Candidatus Omnitrophota bacterium]
MSRIGKKPIDIPGGVKVEVKESVVFIEGPKGALEHRIRHPIKVTVTENKVIVKRVSDEKRELSLHGMTRALIANMIKGVTEGYAKELEIKGVGFKAKVEGNTLEINLGFSHPIKHQIAEGITVKAPKPTQLVVSGVDKVKVGEVAAEIRDYFKPEPYTGKGIRYANEYVRHKAGKTVVK